MSVEVKRGESLNKSSMYLGTHQSILQDHCPLHFWTILVNNTECCKPFPKLLLLFMVVNSYMSFAVNRGHSLKN